MPTLRLARLLLAVVMFVAAPAGVALALTMPKIELDDLAKNATGIVRGTVTGKEAAWDAEHRFILTRYTVRVDETVKAFGAGNEVTFTELGGVVGETGLEVPGVPVYDVGEEVVLFLHADRGRLMTLAWGQGKFHVSRAGKSVARVRQGAGDVDQPLDVFLAHLRGVVGR